MDFGEVKQDLSNKYLEDNKENLNKYKKYYLKVYKHYSEMDSIKSIRDIEIEQARLKGQLQKNNNPIFALYISIMAVVFSTIINLTFDLSDIANYFIKSAMTFALIVILTILVNKGIVPIAIPYRNNIQFYTTALEVLESMKNEKLRERKYKKRR
ncbi:TPA: hypothetical protein ACMVR8_001404 [Clostridioides difficile]|uniref:hypothetical protein n=1 Tax=Clostridioides difficile TaxID=1496 RepID=UPI00038D6F77|nr:hypothetical protein [Clostridioides difficile]OFU02471.1 hypothetical protein HMPREF3083_14435 [Clostridium sp. HMSC19D07]OFU34496.1 hypothetical protein HMPREF3075_03810 [Clostridium sp. HMSC19B11]EGT3847357.1 hypothetical protein [Clostridioides difficile]EGT4531959.1 hypothetical protein [Clostridioides difficile]EGT4699234.1 hypothetical protein [Clostridioides difficile]